MKANKRVLFYGNSVILGSLVASLRHLPEIEVTTLTLPLQKTQTVDAATTNILLFDLETTSPEAVLPLLETNPTLQLIGISPDINLIKIWSIRELRELSMLELLNVIKSKPAYSPIGSGDDDSHCSSAARSCVKER